MICPKDLVQMHQKNKVGGGETRDDVYYTWELKVCPACGRVVQETYEARVLTPEEEKNITLAYEWGEGWRKRQGVKT